MKKVYRSFSIILTLALVLAFMPVTAFAAEDEIVYPKAVYTITNNDKPVELKYDYLTKELNFPKKGDVVKIFYGGDTGSKPDETYVYGDDGFDGGDDLLKLKYQVVGSDYSKSSIDLRIYRKTKYYYIDSGLQFDIRGKENVTRLRAPLKSFSYSPSRIRLDSEKIKITANGGGTMYKFSKRTTAGPEGQKMESECALGDKVTTILEDGSVTTYNSRFTSENGSYGIKFVNDKGESLRVYAKTQQIELFRGDNNVSLFIGGNPDITANVAVFVWTPDMGPFPGDYDTPSDATNSGTGSSSGSYTGTPSVSGSISSAVKALNDALKSLTVAKAKIISAKKTNSKIKLNLKPLTKKQLKNVSKIQVQYSTSKKFKKADTKSVFINKNKKTYTTKKLKKDTYYTRVRNMRKVGNKKYYSKWSPVKIVRFK